MVGRLRYQSHDFGDMEYKMRDNIEGKKRSSYGETAYTAPMMSVMTTLVERQGKDISQGDK